MGPIRQRKALSCVDCRRRKVKCDRTIPYCIRCQKNGIADQCTYVAVVGPSSDPVFTPSNDSPGDVREEQAADLDSLIAPWQRQEGFHRASDTSYPTAAAATATSTSRQPIKSGRPTKDLLARITELETYIKSTRDGGARAEVKFGMENARGPDYNPDRNPVSDYDKVMVRGKSFSTQYFGPTFPISLLLQFEELSQFVKSVLTLIPFFGAAKMQIRAMCEKSRTRPQGPVPFDTPNLLAMIPRRELVDRYVNHYLETFETTYRVLHVPSFSRDYEAFWEEPRKSKPEFLVQLLLVMACVYCVTDGGPAGYVGRSSAQREVASRWIMACESWLSRQSKKHMTMSDLQSHVLIFQARRMNCIKIKQEWINSGTLVRLAMNAGMHREPSLLSHKINPFECEMRRRLWFTILELDLQMTIGRGTTPSVDAYGWDTLPPRNIHDEGFDESSVALPASRPKTVFTRTSFLHTINEYLVLRIEILARINSVRLGMDLETVMQYDNKLRKIIDGLPTWNVKSSTVSSAAATPSDSRNGDAIKSKERRPPPQTPSSYPSKTSISNLATQLVRLIAYEFILFLHIPFVAQTKNQARYFYTTASRRDAAIKCLRIYDAFLPISSQLFLCSLREDYLRACLSMCHDLVVNQFEDPISNFPKACDLIENIVNLLLERVRAQGQGFHGFWITTTGLALAKWRLSGGDDDDDDAQSKRLEQYARECTDQVTTLFQNCLLARQVAMPGLDGTSAEENNPQGMTDKDNSLVGANSNSTTTAVAGHSPSKRRRTSLEMSTSSRTLIPTTTNSTDSLPRISESAADNPTTNRSGAVNMNLDMTTNMNTGMGMEMEMEMEMEMDDTTTINPMWDFMTFDFGSVWNLGLEGYSLDNDNDIDNDNDNDGGNGGGDMRF